MTGEAHSTSSGQVKVRFWGVRGSIPAPLTAADVRKKKVQAVKEYIEFHETFSNHPFADPEKFFDVRGGTPDTHGGNTSCVEVRIGGKIFVLDMGTGLRPFGNSLIPEMFKYSGLQVVFLNSHVHWDHLQGIPFFAPLYASQENGIRNFWRFLGGTNWQRTAEVCLKGQMDPPTFPISWSEIEKMTYDIKYDDLHDQKRINFGDGIQVLAGKLEHPQETYGFRFELPGPMSIAYTTDNEPRDPNDPDPRLRKLADKAKVWITDCQYTKEQYEGKKEAGGVPRHGWGHSYPEAVAKTAVMSEVETVVLFHHDPGSSDEKIAQMVVHTQNIINGMGGQSKVIAAWEGLELAV